MLSSARAPQRIGDGGLIACESGLQRCRPVRIRGVGIGAGRQQHLHGLGPAVQRRQHQRRAAAVIARIDGRLLAQQRLQRRDIAQLSGLAQLRGRGLQACRRRDGCGLRRRIG